MSGGRAEAVDRPTVEFERTGRRWRGMEAWRASSGHGLAYFVPLERGRPVSSDEEDRRALLEPGRTLAELQPGELEALLAAAAPLTPTERRLTTRDGDLWLVQEAGPVWAESGGVAEGATGLVCTRLTGPPERRGLPGDGISSLPEEELLARLGRGT